MISIRPRNYKLNMSVGVKALRQIPALGRKAGAGTQHPSLNRFEGKGNECFVEKRVYVYMKKGYMYASSHPILRLLIIYMKKGYMYIHIYMYIYMWGLLIT